MPLGQLIKTHHNGKPFNNKVYCYYLIAVMVMLASVLFIDRPLAEYLHQLKPHSPVLNGFFLLLSKIPLFLEILAGVIVVSGLISQYRVYVQQLIKPIIYVVIGASIIRVSAKVIFGRTWPETWTNNNPSWIENGIEAFHPFSMSASYHSFPSGHALFTFALASLFWHFCPKLYWLWLALMIGVVMGQLTQNYHYLGDLLAGGICGLFVTQFSINYLAKR